MKSRFSELAAEYENFEVDLNWQQVGSKPKEAYMKGASPRLSIAPQKLEAVKEEPRRIHFAHPIAATHVVEYESSMCTTT
ncbi:hypothetical protein TELCIR_26315, partial [Teladorsagia circumcincta]